MKLINWKDDFLKRVVIIGAGASGMLAAKVASDRGYKVIVLEKQKRCGQKLLITGKGRCNITNNCEIEELIENVPTNGKFLYSAFYTFTNDQVIDMFNDLGVETKTERGKRVFPVSDKAVDVVRALEKQMRSNKNVEVLLNSKVDKIEAQDGKVKKVILSDKREIECDSVIVATGGVSYPRTGSSGDGYKFARNLGHTIIKPKASLIGLEVMEDYVTDLAKLSLRNVSINVYNSKNKKIYDDFGEMEFTKYGLDGPIIKSASCRMGDLSKENYKIVLDLKPALDEDKLDKRIQKDFLKYQNKSFKNSLNDLLPQKIIPLIIRLSGIPEEKKVNVITKDERKNLVNLIKNIKMEIKGLRPIAEAIVTAGGVNTLEIDPSTMKSKLIANLSFAGEVIDVDAFTGGYNVQIALSTGYIAGSNI